MAITSTGYDGTVTEVQWSALAPKVGASTYGVVGKDDFVVTAHPSIAQAVNVSAGSGWGHGVLDTSDTVATVQCDAITAGTRWDLIAIRRDWSTNTTSLVKVTGTSTKAIPTRANNPGTLDEQPIALVQWTSGQTQPTATVDLRVWASTGGALAKDDLAKDYLASIGSSLTVGMYEWQYIFDPTTGNPAWVPIGQVDIGAVTYSAPFGNFGYGYGNVQVTKDITGRVHLEGVIGTTAASITLDGVGVRHLVGTIPLGFRPASQVYKDRFIGDFGVAGRGSLYIYTNGEIRYEHSQAVSVAKASFAIDADGISWRAA